MLSANLNKLYLYIFFALCQFAGQGCAYGAQSIAQAKQLNLTLPAGFNISIFASLAENTGQPRMLAFDSKGRLYAAIGDSGKIVMLLDANNDGVAEPAVTIVSGLNNPNSIAFIDDYTMLIGNQDSIVTTRYKDGVWGKPTPFISALPAGGHSLKTVKIGPDKHIYVNVGSSCNVCVETDPLRATILRYSLDGKPAGNLITVGRHVANPTWAGGLRNSQSFAWQPITGAMFATNNGSDMRSDSKNGKVNDDIPPEHLNKIEQGKHYGWPYCWGLANNVTKTNTLMPDPNFTGPDSFCKTATPPAFTFTSHSTPIGITFLDKSNFPAEYKSDVIVALHGSWNRKNPSGYKLVRVKFEQNNPIAVVDFATGWLLNNADENAAWGRPVDIIVGPDGALYVSDDRAGNIYRISYSLP